MPNDPTKVDFQRRTEPQVNLPMNQADIQNAAADNEPIVRNLGLDGAPAMVDKFIKTTTEAGGSPDKELINNLLSSNLDAALNSTIPLKQVSPDYIKFIGIILSKINLESPDITDAERNLLKEKLTNLINLLKSGGQVESANLASETFGKFLAADPTIAIDILLRHDEFDIEINPTDPVYLIFIRTFFENADHYPNGVVPLTMRQNAATVFELMNGDIVLTEVITTFWLRESPLGTDLEENLKVYLDGMDPGDKSILIMQLQNVARRLVKNQSLSTYDKFNQVVVLLWPDAKDEIFGSMSRIEAFKGQPTRMAQFNNLTEFKAKGMAELLAAQPAKEAELIDVVAALHEGFIAFDVMGQDPIDQSIVDLFIKIFIELSNHTAVIEKVWDNDRSPLEVVGNRLAVSAASINSPDPRIANRAGQLYLYVFNDADVFGFVPEQSKLNLMGRLIGSITNPLNDELLYVILEKTKVEPYLKLLSDFILSTDNNFKLQLFDNLLAFKEKRGKVAVENFQQLKRLWDMVLLFDPDFEIAFRDHMYEKREKDYNDTKTLLENIDKKFNRDRNKEVSDDVKAKEWESSFGPANYVAGFVNRWREGSRRKKSEETIDASITAGTVESVHDFYLILTKRPNLLYLTSEDPELMKIFGSIILKIFDITKTKTPEQALKEAMIIMNNMFFLSSFAAILPVEILEQKVAYWDKGIENYNQLKAELELEKEKDMPEGWRNWKARRDIKTELGEMAKEMLEPKNLVLNDMIKILKNERLLTVYLKVPGFLDKIQDVFEVLAARSDFDSRDRKVIEIIALNPFVWDKLSEKTRYDFCLVIYNGCAGGIPGYGDILEMMLVKVPPANKFKYPDVVAFFGATYRLLPDVLPAGATDQNGVPTPSKEQISNLITSVSTRKRGFRENVAMVVNRQKRNEFQRDQKGIVMLQEIVTYASSASKTNNPEVIIILNNLRSKQSQWRATTVALTQFDGLSTQMETDANGEPNGKPETVEALKTYYDGAFGSVNLTDLTKTIEFGSSDELRLTKFIDMALNLLFNYAEPYEASKEANLNKIIEMLNKLLTECFTSLNRRSRERVMVIVNKNFENSVNAATLAKPELTALRPIIVKLKADSEKRSLEGRFGLLTDTVIDLIARLNDPATKAWEIVRLLQNFMQEFINNPEEFKKIMALAQNNKATKNQFNKLLEVLFMTYYKFDRVPAVFKQLTQMIKVIAGNSPPYLMAEFHNIHLVAQNKDRRKLNKKVKTDVNSLITFTAGTPAGAPPAALAA